MYIQLILLTCFIALPYIIVLMRNLIADIYLWQTKEYRLDRVWSQWHYEKDKGFRSELMTMLKIAFLTFAIAFTLVPEQEVLAVSFLMAFFFYWYQGLDFLQKLFRKKFVRFQLRSLRNLLIAAINIIIYLSPVVIMIVWLSSLNYIAPLPAEQQILLSQEATFNDIVSSFIPKNLEGVVVIRPEYIIIAIVTAVGIVTDLLGPLFVGLGVLLTSPLATIKRRMLIASAKKKLSKLKKLKVVAVTGSYGKSTTKELLYQILDKKFKTVKTEKNNNTDVGIALTILKKINSNTEVFVAEMGAYKIGETRDCCKIAPPDVAIITGIDQQHVSLFGGIKEVLASTYEVVEEMRPDGLTILNGDNEYCFKIAEKTNKRKLMYYSIHNASKLEASELSFNSKETSVKHKLSFPGNENVFVKDIESNEQGLAFIMNYDGVQYQIKTNLKARYNISNLMAAMLTANELGVTMAEVVKIVNKLDFAVPYLNVKEGINNSKIIDHGYNANPTGFLAALKFMQSLGIKQKKWVFTQGLIELGPERVATNNKVATAIIATADVLYTTDSALYEQIKIIKPEFEAKLVSSVFDFSVYYESLVKQGHYVLIEGSFPQEVLKKIYVNYYQ